MSFVDEALSRTDRLPTAGEVLGAAIERLATWSPERVEAGMAGVARLVVLDTPIDRAQPAVAELLQCLGAPNDGRSPWTALAALLVLHADALGDLSLFWRAGVVLLRSAAQTRRARVPRRRDALDELLGEYLSRHPTASAAKLWAHCESLPRSGFVVNEVVADTLTYWTGLRLRDVSRATFAVRVSRIRRRIARPKLQEPVSVSRVAHSA